MIKNNFKIFPKITLLLTFTSLSSFAADDPYWHLRTPVPPPAPIENLYPAIPGLGLEHSQQQKINGRPYRDYAINVLSIDGGGVKGVIPATFLHKLEETSFLPEHTPVGIEQKPYGIYELFDMVVGTSTGAILALGLTTEIPPIIGGGGGGFRTASDMLNLYSTMSKRIFKPVPWYNPVSWTSPVWTYQYSPEPLEKELEKYFADKTLRDITSVKSVITSVNLRDHEVKLFRSYDPTENFYIRDVARATSAAPSYFPMKRIKPIGIIGSELPLVDGGVGANNPSHIALAEAYQQYGYGPVNLISLGCGKEDVTHPDKEYPYVERGGPTIELLFNSTSNSVHQSIETLSMRASLGINYYRLDVPLQSALMPMDKPGNIDILRGITISYLNDVHRGLPDFTRAAKNITKAFHNPQRRQGLMMITELTGNGINGI